MSLPRYAVRHPVTTRMLFLAVVLVGAFCLAQFPVDQMPAVDIPALTVLTYYEGAASEDVENKVTQVLEDSLSSLPDLKHITSVSSEGLSKITLSFEWKTDLDTRANDARDAIDKAKIFLPSDIEPPRVLKFNLADFPILIYGVRARESFSRLETLLKDQIADPLKRIPGVALAAVISPLERQVNVYADRDRLAAHGLTIADVARAIRTENQDISAGNLKSGTTDYLLRVLGEFQDVEAMKELVVAMRAGRLIRLGDVATLEDAFKEQSQYVTVDGQPGAAIVIRKQSGGNTVQVAEAVKKRLPELTQRLPRDIQLIPVMDGSEDIRRMVHNLTDTLWQGAGLAVLVVLIFLRRWRATVIVALSIPYSLMLALVGMFFLGYTVNMMTLFGLIIAVGMVVDNAIVILENITRHREAGERADEGAIHGTTEVGLAVAASTLTTLCIFFPILFVKGITKVFFSEFAVVANIALLGSLFSALTLTPMLTSTLLRQQRFTGAPPSRFFRLTERGFTALERVYVEGLGWALTHRKTILLGAASLFCLTLLLLPRLGTEFMPAEDRNTIRGTLFLPVGTRVETTHEVLRRWEAIVREEVPPHERVTTFTRCGASPSSLSAALQDEDAHIGAFSLRLVEPRKRNRSDRDIAAALRRRLQVLQTEFPVEKFTLETTDLMSSIALGNERALTINILGDDLEDTDRLARAIRDLAANTPGAVDIAISREQARPELRVILDREKANALGLNVSSIGATIRAAFHGQFAGKYRIQGDEYDIVVKLQGMNRTRPEDVAALPLRLPSGAVIRLDHVARVEHDVGPVRIDRKDQTRVVHVTGDVYGRSLGDVAADIQASIARLSVPPGIEIKMAGQTEDQRESFFWLTVSLAIGTVLVYMVMASQFESLLAPLVVMFSVPFAFTGVIVSLWLRGFHVNVIVFIGLLLLVGTVVNNAIVLVDYIGTLRARGQSLTDAVKNAGRTRLRPVLMTALTTMTALLPMALKRGQGAEVWQPLGTVVIGGLAMSTLVTLILIPTLYSVVETRGKRSA